MQSTYYYGIKNIDDIQKVIKKSLSYFNYLIFSHTFYLGDGMHIGTNDVKCNIGGPNYWCKNKETAALCKAVSYCQENVWSLKQVKWYSLKYFL